MAPTGRRRWSGWPRRSMPRRSRVSRPISPSCARRPRSPEFKAMRLDTGWLDREGTQSLAAEQPADPATLLLAALATVALEPRPAGRRRRCRAPTGPRPGTGATPGGSTSRRAAWSGCSTARTCTSSPSRARRALHRAPGRRTSCTPAAASPTVGSGSRATGRRRSFPAAIVGHTLTLTLDGRRRTLVLEDGRFAARGEEEDSGLFTAPDAGQGDQAAGGRRATG